MRLSYSKAVNGLVFDFYYYTEPLCFLHLMHVYTFEIWRFADNGASQRRLLYGQLSLPVDSGGSRGSVDGGRLGSINEDGFIEEERQLLRGVRVRAATVDRLVALVVNCFGM